MRIAILLAAALSLTACAGDDSELYDGLALASAKCSDHGRQKIIAFGQHDGPAPTWLQTNDTRDCRQAGIGDNFWKTKD